MSVWNFSLGFIPHYIFFKMFALFFWLFQQRNTEIWLMWQFSALIWLRLWCVAVMTQTRCSVFTGWLVGGWYTQWPAAVSRPSLYFHFPLWVVSLLIVCYPVCSSASRLHPQSHPEKLSLTLCLGCFFWILPHIMLLYALSLQNCYNALHMRSHDLWFLSYSFFLPTTFSSL